MLADFQNNITVGLAISTVP